MAEAKGVEAVVAAMQRFSHQTTVQLSALLCFIPLALENIMMQVSNSCFNVDYHCTIVKPFSTDIHCDERLLSHSSGAKGSGGMDICAGKLMTG